MNSNWSQIPRPALRIIVLAGLMYGVGLPLIHFSRSGDVRQFLTALIIGVGAAALLPIILLIRRMLIYLEFFIFWYLAIGIAIAALIFGALALLYEGGPYGLVIGAALSVLGGVWWFASRGQPPVTEAPQPSRPRRVGRPVEPEPEHPTQPRRPSPPPGKPDPDRINKELAARKQRMGTN